MITLGAHVPAADPLSEAEARGVGAVQLFLGNPQSWKKPLPRKDAEQLRNSALDIYVHAPYLVNVVNRNNRVRIPSRKILTNTVEAAEEIGAAGVIVHGGHVTNDEAVEDGFPRWRKALEMLETDIPILIENTASGNNAQARATRSSGPPVGRNRRPQSGLLPRHMPRLGRWRGIGRLGRAGTPGDRPYRPGPPQRLA